MKGLQTAKYALSGVTLVLSAMLLSACAATNPLQSGAMTEADNGGLPLSMKTGYGHGSEIPGQLDDGGWVLNIPGKAHTHKVLLAECPDKPIITNHTHDQLQLGETIDSLGEAAHKHNGCFICPPKNSLVKRITSN